MNKEVIKVEEEKVILNEFKKLIEYAKNSKMNGSVIQSLICHKDVQENFIKRFQ